MTRAETQVTPAEAKQVWESLEVPSDPEVARWFERSGRTISRRAIRNWRLKGWKSGETPADVTVRVLAAAAPSLLGDCSATLADLVEAAHVVAEPPNPLAPAMSEAERIKNSARKFIDCLTACSERLTACVNEIIPDRLGELGPALSGLARMQLAAAVGYNQAIAIAERSMKLQDEERHEADRDGPIIDHDVPQLLLPAPRPEDDPLALEISSWERGARGA